MVDISESMFKALVRFAYEASPSRGVHITRYSMYRALFQCLATFDAPDRRVLSISNSVHFGRNILGLKTAQYTEANYPAHNMLELKFADASFDACISDQVLEHIEGSPFVATQETCRVIKPGGYVCHTTCFVNEIHGAPKDFWRFTPAALELLVRAGGCEPIEIGGWGNREVWALIKSGFRFEGVPNDPKNPIHQLAVQNELDWPLVVWVLARKLPSSAL
jgi:SAM-dependent methyltransferase